MIKLATIKKMKPDAVRELATPDVISAIKRSNALYHDKGKAILPDRHYDILKEELKDRRPNHSLLKAVGAKVTGSRKVQLPYPLYSLGKFKPKDSDAIERWSKSYPGPYIAEQKIDGSSLEIIYEGGVPKEVYTRGDGVKGQNVSRIIQYLRIPKKIREKGKLVIRAELVMKPSTFETVARKEGYQNPRNLVAGLANSSKSDSSLLKHAHVMAYEIIYPRTLNPSKAIRRLKAYGFDTVKFVVLQKLDVEDLKHLFMSTRKGQFEMDGLVVEQDRINRRPPSGTHSPDYAWAFKMDLDEDSVQAKVLGVNWEESTRGIWKPVVAIEPVQLKGVKVKQATGHNAFFIVNGFRKKEVGQGLPVRPIGKGAVIMIRRSGDVIPKIEEVLKGAARPEMPPGRVQWNKSGTDLVVMHNSDMVRNKRIESFFVTLGVDGIKLGTVVQLADAGMDSILKILRADVNAFLRVPGFQKRKAETLYANIKAKTKNVDLPVLMDGSGHFGIGMGTRRLADIVKAYPKVLDWGDKPKAWIIDKVAELPGFQENTAEKFAVGLPKFLKWYKAIRIKAQLPKAIKQTSSSMKGQVVAMTGFRDEALSTLIKQNGGSIASGVSSKTTILLVASKASGSSKATKARELGIKIMTGMELRKRYNL